MFFITCYIVTILHLLVILGGERNMMWRKFKKKIYIYIYEGRELKGLDRNQGWVSNIPPLFLMLLIFT